MQRRLIGILGVLGALSLTAGACIKDPLGDRDGAAAAIITDVASLTLAQGEAATVTATVVDGRSIPIATPITFAGCDANVSAADDPAYAPVPENTSDRAVVTAVGLAATCVEVSGGGVTETVEVIVLPTAFAGTANSADPVVGEVLTFQATANLKFSASSNIDFGGGILGEVVSVSAEALSVRVPQVDDPAAGPLTVTDVNVSYVPGGFSADLPTSTSFSAVTNPNEPNDAPDPAVTLPIPAPGTSVDLWDGFKGGLADKFYTVSVAATDTITVTLSWSSAADLDILWCDAGCNAFVGNFDGASTSNPEQSTVIFAAGSYNLYINNFTPSEDARLFKITVSHP